ncbi:unnamed protein product [Somion occarium]|uniref:Uncharacterized protein n=1 Tax=Somion occarium TaxID=3059160 RepID=A0ABP1EEW8_9APHY
MGANDVAGACRVSRSWSKGITSLLYKHVTLATPEQVRLFLRILRTSQCPIELVEKIIPVDHRKISMDQNVDTYNRRVLVQMREDVRSVFSIRKGVQGFTVNFNRTSDPIGDVVAKD